MFARQPRRGWPAKLVRAGRLRAAALPSSGERYVSAPVISHTLDEIHIYDEDGFTASEWSQMIFQTPRARVFDLREGVVRGVADDAVGGKTYTGNGWTDKGCFHLVVDNGPFETWMKYWPGLTGPMQVPLLFSVHLVPSFAPPAFPAHAGVNAVTRAGNSYELSLDSYLKLQKVGGRIMRAAEPGARWLN